MWAFERCRRCAKHYQTPIIGRERYELGSRVSSSAKGHLVGEDRSFGAGWANDRFRRNRPRVSVWSERRELAHSVEELAG